ncbi:cytochrome c-type biogenesis protein CcmH [Pseudochelatococcus lubricantis]|uniref:Cytochrome c-type biogenesis protein CcmH n=1 Tax=Pseudochelatococcus lubricantis TaxID=1538102 RepID=A0ABX0V2Z2_9HYPH|nr:c-type cytochrome biogenesis protein CcmI [Pseudochelatococcus lubricantis]NIJ58590.1 cytochrome c-type biogenesis protein CcmH [Pseudochelatococcus lubricantis]
MTIWFVFALMTGASVLLVLWPLSRRQQAAGGRVDDKAFFRQQIADIEREVARGLLPESEGEAARTEAGRRLLRAMDQQTQEGDQKGEPALRRRRAASAIALSAIPLVALTLYGALGQPDVPDAPLSKRLAEGDPRSLNLNEAVARVEGHLARQPEDGRGWEVLAPIYLRAGRFQDAVRAYGEALRLNGASGTRLANLGEAMVMAGDGVVSAEARTAFDKALAAEPGNAKAGFYLALAAEQDGDVAGALARLRELLASAPADAPWRPAVEARIAALADPARSEAGQAIAGMAPEDRMQAIRGMVAQLAARAAAGEVGLDEWLRLIRSYAVLGDRTEAAKALASARERLAGDDAALRRLDTLAGELHIERESAAPPAEERKTEGEP